MVERVAISPRNFRSKLVSMKRRNTQGVLSFMLTQSIAFTKRYFISVVVDCCFIAWCGLLLMVEK
jgi:hypothetical protein